MLKKALKSCRSVRILAQMARRRRRLALDVLRQRFGVAQLELEAVMFYDSSISGNLHGPYQPEAPLCASQSSCGLPAGVNLILPVSTK